MSSTRLQSVGRMGSVTLAGGMGRAPIASRDVTNPEQSRSGTGDT
jgi:hypothetical protein